MRFFLFERAVDMTSGKRQRVHVSINADVLQKARDLRIDISRAAEDGIRRAIMREELQRDADGIAEAVRSSNEYVRKHGLPLRGYR